MGSVVKESDSARGFALRLLKKLRSIEDVSKTYMN